VKSRARPLTCAAPGGFTLVEMIVVVFLLALAMLGLLSVFDASARINKSESDVADAQGAVRYGIYSMTRAIRMAGSGGLYVTQAVLNARDKQLPGISVANSVLENSYDNVETGTTVTPLSGDSIPVRPGTDMIEVRGVINSPLIGFDLATGCDPCNPVTDPSGGCAPCVGAPKLNAAATTNTPHVNNNTANRPQFSQIDAYTAGATAGTPMLVLVAFNDDVHANCSIQDVYPLYPQSPYNVGVIKAATTLVATSTFGTVDFTDTNAKEFNTELPVNPGTEAGSAKNVRHAGILDDMIFFIDNTNSLHPALAQGTRRGDKFDVVTLADDVEDMQIAYGVDLDAIGTPGYGAINRIAAKTDSDADTNVSSQPAGDEWVPNVPGADNPITHAAVPFLATDFYDPNHCPSLHAVMISLVAKSHDPDPTYRAPSARGLLTMNSPVTIAPPHPDTAHYSGIPVTTYRRRVQTLKINLRNYAYEGS
jgi:prepilin-type N-terminal cleavage/methylation domain-containing protein